MSSADREQVMDWQPIETAPKDGTKILVFVEDDVYQANWHNKRGWEFPIADQHPSCGCGYCMGGEDHPKWWMPMPKAPE